MDWTRTAGEPGASEALLRHDSSTPEPTDSPFAARRVLVVDDTRLSREALTSLLEGEPWIAALDAAGDVAATMERLRNFCPDVVLLNMATVGSLAIVGAVAGADTPARVVAIGVSGSEDEVIALAEAGVAGYLLRGASRRDLAMTMHSLARGESLCPPQISTALLRRVASLAAERRSQAPGAHLTAREHQVLRLIDQGLSNRQIAQHLGIEVRTVKNHVHNLLEKLHVHRRGEAAARMRGVGPSDTGPSRAR